MSKMIMMMGLPGSGKSTIAKAIAEENNGKIFSSDDIREELFGDASNQSNPDIVFGILHTRLLNHIKSGGVGIFDATNLSHERRKQFVELTKQIDPECDCICVYVYASASTCIARNQHRSRQVPRGAIRRMAFSTTSVTPDEGWDEIAVYNTEDATITTDSYMYLNDRIEDTMHKGW